MRREEECGLKSTTPFFFGIKQVTSTWLICSHSANLSLSAAILASLERMPAEQFETTTLDAVFLPSQHFSCMQRQCKELQASLQTLSEAKLSHPYKTVSFPLNCMLKCTKDKLTRTESAE